MGYHGLACVSPHRCKSRTLRSPESLVLGYTLYLCIMSRVPRPFPLVVPNELLTGSTQSHSRATSLSSITSTTGLLTKNNAVPPILPTTRPTSPASIQSYHSFRSTSSRTVPKRLFVVNAAPGDTLARMRREQEEHREAAYGAMAGPDRRPRVLQSRFSGSTIASTHSLDAPPPRIFSTAQSFVRAALSRQPSARIATPVVPVVPERREQEPAPPRIPPRPLRPLLLSQNPFMEPLSRHGTPETALSSQSFASAPANLNWGHVAAYNPFDVPQTYGPYLTPHRSTVSAGIPPQLQPGLRSTGSISSSDSMSANLSAIPIPNTSIPPHMIAPHVSYTGAPLVPPRLHTATPGSASIHSMVPSLHGTDEYGQPITVISRAPERSYSGAGTAAPPQVAQQAHIRAGSDPIQWRPYSAGPRVYAYDDVELPNPYNRGAEIRRYGSVPHVRSGSYGGLGYAYGVPPVPYGGAGYYMTEYVGQGAGGPARGIARGFAGTSGSGWREVVIRAAATS